MRNHFEWLRLITPILSGITLFILTQLYGQLSELNNRIYLHQINADIHVTRSEFVTIQHQIEEARKEVIAVIKREVNHAIKP